MILVDGDTVKLRAADFQESCSPNLDVFLIRGAPWRQPTFRHGPFVMSNKTEVI